MRLRAVAFVLAALAGVGLGAWRLGEATTAWVERETLTQARAALAGAGETWAGVEADGLRVTLTGAAPDEARRLAADSVLRRIVDPRRLHDATTPAAAPDLPDPAYGLELLRSDAEVSAIGLAPAGGRAALARAVARAGLAAPGDMLEEVARAAPAGWEPALDLALAALAELPRSKISVAPGRVAVSALAPDAEAAEAAAARLRAAAPAGVELALDIAAPRPAIAPFRFDFALEAGVGRLDACDMETPEDAARLAGAARAGACRIGLGAPSPDWARAAETGLAAVRGLGAGRFTLADLAATLRPPPGADPDQAEAVAARLAADLPKGFTLRFDAPLAPARFEATLDGDGALRLSGALRDAMSRQAVEAYAEALFGDGRVEGAPALSPDLPEGWPARVLAALEALALMREGRVKVTPDLVTLEGWAATAETEAQAEALLAAKAGGPVDLAIDFDAKVAEAEAQAEAAAADPAGACLDGARGVMGERGIGFEPGSARLSDEGLATVAAIGAVLANCPPLDLEIAGHTDASGSAEANLALSQDRALAVQFALQAVGLPQMRFIARGYGPDRPIADNDTEEGRARNRRIEFALVGRAADAPEPVGDEAGPPAPEPEPDPDPDPDPEPAPSQTETRDGPQ